MLVETIIKNLSDDAVMAIEDSTQHLEGSILLCKLQCERKGHGTYQSALSVEINGAKHQFLFTHHNGDTFEAINGKYLGDDYQKILDNHVAEIIEDKLEIIQEEIYFQTND
jgi:hypothetical protein